MFFAAELRSFSHHLSPAFHHKFTIKKPPSAPRFSQNPPQKRHSTNRTLNQRGLRLRPDDLQPSASLAFSAVWELQVNRRGIDQLLKSEIIGLQ
jgi:hypothetical protein